MNDSCKLSCDMSSSGTQNVAKCCWNGSFQLQNAANSKGNGQDRRSPKNPKRKKHILPKTIPDPFTASPTLLPDRRDDYFDEDEDGLFSRIGKKLDGIWVVHGEEHVIRGRVGHIIVRFHVRLGFLSPSTLLLAQSFSPIPVDLLVRTSFVEQLHVKMLCPLAPAWNISVSWWCTELQCEASGMRGMLQNQKLLLASVIHTIILDFVLFPVFNSSGISMLTSVKLVVPIRCWRGDGETVFSIFSERNIAVWKQSML